MENKLRSRMMKKTAIPIIMLAFLFSSLNAEEAKYTNNSLARLSYITGNAYIQRASDLAYEEAAVNLPIAEGDRLGTTDGRAEIYLGKGNYFRLDYNTKIDFLSLPKKEDDLIQIRIWGGNAYLSVETLEIEKGIEIHTSDVSLYILDEGLYRIDVRENTKTEILVFNGLVEAAGETGSSLIKKEQKLEAVEGRIPSHPSRFIAAVDDSFDEWSESRDFQIQKHLAKRYLPEELEDFEYELSEYGEWSYVPSYGYVWVPGRVDTHWRPYYHGRWVWIPICGWTWHPYEPWGWATSHFGRWHWSLGLGWYWIPTGVWGPGWVSWHWGHDYYGWAPLSYYGYPGVIIDNRYYGHYNRADYPYNSRALTVIHKNQLKTRNISKIALSQNSVNKLGKISLTNRAPAIRPETKISIEKLEGRKVFLHNNEDAAQFRVNKSFSSLTAKNPEGIDSGEATKVRSRSIKPSEERGIIKREKDDPSSSSSDIKKYSNTIKSKKSDSIISRIYNHISGGDSKTATEGSSRSSSRGTSSQGTVSRSKSRTSSSARKSPPPSSSRAKTKSKKVKKN